MTTDQTITVSEWIEPPTPVIQEVQPRRWFFPPGIIGLAGTLALHGLVLQTVLVVNRAHRISPPDVPILGSSQHEAGGNPAERLVFISLSGTANSDRGGKDMLAWVKVATKVTPIKVDHLDSLAPLNLETLALDEEKQSESSSDNDESAERARLYGIYSGQIQARVERIWTRPRTPVNDESSSTKTKDAVDYFHCQVQVVQDSDGFVQEVMLPNCNGSPAWQRSLVVAIQQASPLPAPPSSHVFTRSLSLEFTGFPYINGASEEGYETVRIETARIVVPAKTPEQIAHDFLPFRPTGPEQH